MSRRDELVEAATDYVLANGLVDLTLRPMAAALGTSDRMLLYHFGSKDELVTAILETSNARTIAHLRALPHARDLRGAVTQLWKVVRGSSVAASYRVYIEASALGLLGQQPYADAMRTANAEWLAELSEYFAARGAPRRRAQRIAVLVDAAFMGFMLDAPLEEDAARTAAVADLAAAAAALGA